MYQEGWEPLHWIITWISILYGSTWTYPVSTSHATRTTSPQTRSLPYVPEPIGQLLHLNLGHVQNLDVHLLSSPLFIHSISKSWCFCLLGIAWIYSLLLFQLVPKHFTSSLLPYSSVILSPSSARGKCPSFIWEFLVKTWVHHSTCHQHHSTCSVLQSFSAGLMPPSRPFAPASLSTQDTVPSTPASSPYSLLRSLLRLWLTLMT